MIATDADGQPTPASRRPGRTVEDRLIVAPVKPRSRQGLGSTREQVSDRPCSVATKTTPNFKNKSDSPVVLFVQIESKRSSRAGFADKKAILEKHPVAKFQSKQFD